MDLITVSMIINGLLIVAGYLLKNEHSNLKDDNKALWREIGIVKEKYFKKEDFLEFKKELWARLDRMEDDFKQQIQELKK
jgi:uncharacterized membrane protein